MTSHRQIMDAAWDEVIDLKAECDRREAERNKPQPVVTPCLLIAFALVAYAVMLAAFGAEAW